MNVLKMLPYFRYFFIFASFLMALSEQIEQSNRWNVLKNYLKMVELHSSVFYNIWLANDKSLLCSNYRQCHKHILYSEVSFYVSSLLLSFSSPFLRLRMCGCALRTKKKQIRSLVINAICETLAHEHFFHAKFQVLCLLCISIYLNLYTYIMFQCNIIIFTLEVELFHVNYLVFKRSFVDFCMRSNKQNNMFEHWIYVIK